MGSAARFTAHEIREAVPLHLPHQRPLLTVARSVTCRMLGDGRVNTQLPQIQGTFRQVRFHSLWEPWQWRRGGTSPDPPYLPPLGPPPPLPPLVMFEADSQNFASAPSVPRGFKFQNLWPAFGGDHRGTIGGGRVRPNPPPPSLPPSDPLTPSLPPF